MRRGTGDVEVVAALGWGPISVDATVVVVADGSPSYNSAGSTAGEGDGKLHSI